MYLFGKNWHESHFKLLSVCLDVNYNGVTPMSLCHAVQMNCLFSYYLTVSLSIEDISWTPRGLSVKPRVDKLDFSDSLVSLEYRCGDEILEAADSVDENPAASTPLQSITSHNYSRRPHVLKTKRKGDLTATIKGNDGEPIRCVKEIPPYPGKKRVLG